MRLALLLALSVTLPAAARDGWLADKDAGLLAAKKANKKGVLLFFTGKDW